MGGCKLTATLNAKHMETQTQTNMASTGQASVDTATPDANKNYYTLLNGRLLVQTTRTLKSKSLKADFEKIGEAYEMDPKPVKISYWEAVEKSHIPYAGTHTLWDMEANALVDITAPYCSKITRLKKAIEQENISYGELAELQDLAKSNPDIFKNDPILSQWAGL